MFERASSERNLVSCNNYIELGCSNPGLGPVTERLQGSHSAWSATSRPPRTWAEIPGGMQWHSALEVDTCQQSPESGQLK